jgi:hypothetical protein
VFILRLNKIKTGWLRSAPRRRAATPRPRARALSVHARAPLDVPPPEVAHRSTSLRLRSRTALCPRAFPRPAPHPKTPRFAPHHTPPRRRIIRAPCTRRTAGPSAVRPYAHRPRSAVARRHLGRRHPSSPPGEHAAYKRRHCFPTGGHRATGHHCRPRAELDLPRVPRAGQPPFPLP